MVWEVILGSLAAIGLIVLFAFAVTCLTRGYEKLLEQRWRGKLQRPELIPIYARFAAVVTLTLLLVLSLQMGASG